MSETNTEARAFLEELQHQPEEIRQVFLYVLCQTMVQSGMLELAGAWKTSDWEVTLIYKNPDTGDFFDIAKPQITEEEELAMKEHIGQLLQDKTQMK